MMRARVAHNASLDNWFKGGSAWFGDAALAGGGALFDLGCHTVDVMRWFLGEPESLVAKVENFSGAYDIDDNCVALVKFKSGALGILDVSWVQRSGPNPLEIYGTEGYIGRSNAPGQNIMFSSQQIDLSDLQDGGLPYISPTRMPDPLPMPVDMWVSACLNDTAPTITVEDGRNLTQLLEGIYTSASTGREYRFDGQ